jgi:parallel beta-helix repeat protein
MAGRKMIVGMIMAVLVLMSGTAWGTDYYVAKDGDDDANGMINFPFKTIQYAADYISSGDDVYIRPGTYNEQVIISTGGVDENNYTFFQRDPNTVGEVIIEAPNTPGWDRCIFLSGNLALHHLYFRDLTLRNAGRADLQPDGKAGGANFYADANESYPKSHIILDGLEVEQGHIGIYFVATYSPNDTNHIGVTDSKIINCEIYNNEHGIWLGGRNRNILIENNQISYSDIPEEEQLVTNGDFVNWVSDDPVSWSVIGENGSDPEISEVGEWEGHGGSGSGLANLYTSDGTRIKLEQTLETKSGVMYQIKVEVNKIALGALKVEVDDGVVTSSETFTYPKVHTFHYIPTTSSTTIRIMNADANEPADVTFDNVLVYKNPFCHNVVVYCSTSQIGNENEDIRIINNDIHHARMQGILVWHGKNILIRGNHCHHNGATGIQLESYESRSVITTDVVVEDNICEYNAQTWGGETGVWVDDTNNVIVQNNIMRYNEVGLKITGSYQVIARRNTIYENNNNYINAGGIHVYCGEQQNGGDDIIVHNTVFRNGYGLDDKYGYEGQLSQILIGRNATDPEIKRVVFKNNIASESLANGSDLDLLVRGLTHTLNYNNYYQSQRDLAVRWQGTDVNWPTYLSQSGQDANSITGNPLFVDAANAYFGLYSDSNAIDAGDFLTKTTSSGSSSTTLVVEDARYFSDGYDVCDVDGDSIQVGSTGPVEVIDVNYDSNTLTLGTSISWSANDVVTYYPYSGSSPDMGAYESNIVYNITQNSWYDKIQDAIDDANDGDEIVVYTGTYKEAIDFNGVSCTVRSADPNNWNVVAATVIDANGATQAVDVDANATLSGFTLTGGTYGVYCDSASPTISKCIIKDNSSAGVYCNGGSPEIENNKICDNSSYGIHCNGSSASIKNNWIYRNGNEGLRFVGTAGTAPVVRNNTIAYNTQRGIYKHATATSPTTSNCIIWANNNDLAGCSATYSCIEDGDAGTGNISSDPCFVDADSNDYHLESDSPCIDAGDPGGTYTGEMDIDFKARVFDGDHDSNDVVDMGADETDYPVSHWKFDEGTGTTASDYTGDNNGILMGDPNWVTGKIGGYALYFDGAGDYVKVPDSQSMRVIDGNTSNYTISLWIKTTQAGAALWDQKAIFDRRATNALSGKNHWVAHIYLNDANATGLFIGVGGGTTFSLDDTLSINDGKWHHIVATRKNTEYAKVYVDGNERQNGSTTIDTSTNEITTIGARRTNSNAYAGHFDGTIDDVRIYDRALTTEEIEQLYQDGL